MDNGCWGWTRGRLSDDFGELSCYVVKGNLKETWGSSVPVDTKEAGWMCFVEAIQADRPVSAP